MSAAKSRAGVVAAVLAPSALALLLAAPDLDKPGVYYDEVIQAEPAIQFLAEGGRPSAIPGMTSTRLFGGWFPLMTQPYMGALKSQLLIPGFALFGPSVTSLRATTLAWGLIGMVLAVLFARQLLGPSAALVSAALMAVDPSFLFIARHDWGSFSLGLVCRCGGLLLATWGWRRRTPPGLVIGGLLFGLGLYNKVDFAVFLAATGIALALAAPGVLVEAARTRRAHALAVLTGIALGAAPLFGALRQTLATTRAVAGRQTLESADWAEKLQTHLATLDGSYFHRLMLSGGSFEDMYAVTGAAADPFPWLFAAAAAWLGVRWLRVRWLRAGRPLAPATVFILTSTLLTLAGIFLTPRAVRIHHALNAFPLPHLLVGAAVADLWRVAADRRVWRGVAATALALSLAGSVAVDLRTRAAIRESGGKGRWSDAVARFASELEKERGAVVVTLDWGFEQPLRFLAPDQPVIETIWELRQSSAPLMLEGTPQHVYVMYPEPYSVFDYGLGFLEAVRTLPPDFVALRTHLDREGEPAFLSLRIARPHRLVYRDGFEVTLR